MKNIKRVSKKWFLFLVLAGFSSISHAEALSVPFLNTVWDTFTQVGLPILFGLGLLGAFVADRYDSDTGKRVLLTIAILAIVVKISIAFLAWVKSSFSGI